MYAYWYVCMYVVVVDVVVVVVVVVVDDVVALGVLTMMSHGWIFHR